MSIIVLIIVYFIDSSFRSTISITFRSAYFGEIHLVTRVPTFSNSKLMFACRKSPPQCQQVVFFFTLLSVCVRKNRGTLRSLMQAFSTTIAKSLSDCSIFITYFSESSNALADWINPGSCLPTKAFHLSLVVWKPLIFCDFTS